MVEVTLILKLDDPAKAAIAVWDGDFISGTLKEKWIWLPRSLVSWEPVRGSIRGGEIELTLPEWLAKDKGLI